MDQAPRMQLSCRQAFLASATCLFDFGAHLGPLRGHSARQADPTKGATVAASKPKPTAKDQTSDRGPIGTLTVKIQCHKIDQTVNEPSMRNGLRDLSKSMRVTKQ